MNPTPIHGSVNSRKEKSKIKNDKLTQELLKQSFDYKDGLLYWKVSRNHLSLAGSIAGSIFTHSRRYITLYQSSYSAHKLIFMWHHGYMPEMVDHRDRDCTNDRIENLRGCTYRENNFNKTKSSNPNFKSKYKGVSAHGKKWVMEIGADNVRHVKGRFLTQEAAALEYNRMAVRLHGEFASLNIIKHESINK